MNSSVYGLFSTIITFISICVGGFTIVIRVDKIPTPIEIAAAEEAERVERILIARDPINPDSKEDAKKILRYTREPLLLKIDENGRKLWRVQFNLNKLKSVKLAENVDSIKFVDGRVLMVCEDTYFRILKKTQTCGNSDHLEEHEVTIYLENNELHFQAQKEQDENCWVIVKYTAKDQDTAYWLKGEAEGVEWVE